MLGVSDAKVTDERPPKILVVDDNEANRALAQGTLEDEGFEVVLASGGKAGVLAFEQDRPDCVLLDVRMPDVDGFAACQLIRSLPGGRETPVIFLTALRDVDTFDSALRAGADDFLTKPMRPAELVARVQTVLKIRRLGAELREHYALLKRQRDDLLRVQLQKERLMSFVVHDLKNPVNAMDLHAQVLLRDPESSLSTRESAAQIRNEAKHLNRMILNLLDLSKGDEGKLSARRSDVVLESLVKGLFEELELTARARRIHLESSLRARTVRVDADLFRRVLTNLVENAIRHAPVDTSVTLTTGSSEGGIDVRVADAGVGIPNDMKDRVFDPFVQIGKNANQPVAREGRGLGLAFCKLAIEAHGGSIWIEDGAPGAVFCVSIPNE
jgi:two-component system sensor histidine kinase/response regulator